MLGVFIYIYKWFMIYLWFFTHDVVAVLFVINGKVIDLFLILLGVF